MKAASLVASRLLCVQFALRVIGVGGRESLAGVLSAVPPPFAYAGWSGAAVEGEELIDLRYVGIDEIGGKGVASKEKTRCLRLEVREQKLGIKGATALCRRVMHLNANETNFRAQLAGLSNSGAALILTQAVERYRRCAIEFDCLDEEAFVVALRKLKSDEGTTCLEELSLRWTALEPEGAAALSKLIAKRMPKLKRLYLSGNSDLGDDGIQALAPAISRLLNLEVLALSDCGLSDEGCLALAKALRHLEISSKGRVFDLDVSRNSRLTAHGLSALLARCPKLRILDARCCPLFTNDAPEYERLGALSRSLKRHITTLEHIPLTDVGLDPWGTSLLTKCLLTPTSSLQSLELSINPLTPYELAYRRALPGTSMASRFKAKLFKKAKPKKNIDKAILGGDNTHVAAATTDALVVLASLLASGAAPHLELLRLLETGVTAAHSRRFEKALRKRQNRFSRLPQLDLRFNRDIHKEPEALGSPADAVAMVALGQQGGDDEEDDDDF